MVSSVPLLSSSVLSCPSSRVSLFLTQFAGKIENIFFFFRGVGVSNSLSGNDVIAQAQSGTGKTATFAVAALQKIDLDLKACQALILAPTRELAQQIEKVVIAIGDFMKIDCHACIGGTNVREDMTALRNGPQVVVGTPGRVHDMIQRRVLRTDSMKLFILDEADEMLSVCSFFFFFVLLKPLGRFVVLIDFPAWFHRANLRRLPAPPPVHPGYPAFGHHAPGCPGGHHQVHARPHPYPGQEAGTYP